MRKNILVCLVLTLVFSYFPAFAQSSYKKSGVSSGKETIKFDGTHKVVAKDSVVNTSGNVTSIESFKSNVLRRIANAEDQVEKMKARQTVTENTIRQLRENLVLEQKARKELENKIKELKQKLADLKDSSSDSGKNQQKQQ